MLIGKINDRNGQKLLVTIQGVKGIDTRPESIASNLSFLVFVDKVFCGGNILL
jgi:hypothetical protein